MTDVDHEEQWIIWNGFFGLLDRVTLGEIAHSPEGTQAWLEEPYDMVGPFSLEELQREGSVRFAECVVLSREKWQREQAELRRAGQQARRAAEERIFTEHARKNQKQRFANNHFEQSRLAKFRELLNLPDEGLLKTAEIKAAFRKIAQKAHPDQGGDQEHFVRITEARDALLAHAS